jgi:hypothetical protein
MIKYLYYYYRTVKNRPVMTVCIAVNAEDGIIVSRGVAICNSKDSFCKKKGRKLAQVRAWAAMNVKKNLLPIKMGKGVDNALDIVSVADVFVGLFDYRATFLPKPTEMEGRLLQKAIEKFKESFNRKENVIIHDDDGEPD